MKYTKKYTDAQIEEMEDFISIYFNGNDVLLESEDDATRAKYKEYVEVLCSIDNIQGLRTKAYACYGKGNVVYKTDWKTSEECLLKLVDLDNDHWAANSLGYIYYYGRTTNGVPDYEKAFKYFSVAALYGIYEAIYKIADLCLLGKGVPMKCIRGAENIINWLYKEVKPGFLSGAFDGQFADVASRMGRIYLAKAKEDDDCTDIAYVYFLEALCALKLRKPYDHYGDTSVLSGVRKGLMEAKKKLSFENLTEKDKETLALMQLLEEVSGRNFKVKIKRKGKNAIVHIKDIFIEDDDPIFVVLPTIGYCDFVKDIKIKVTGIRKLKKKYVNKSFSSEFICLDNGELCISSYAQSICCKIKADGFKFDRQKEDDDQKTYTIVSVEFAENGKLYDYLFDLDVAVSEGEKVVVPSYNGEKTVTVKKVSLLTEKELGLPVDDYKKVIRKEILE